MKIKCSVCNSEQDITQELLFKVSELVKEYDMGASGYTYLFNRMFGKCLDDVTHEFDFDEEFKKKIQEIVDREKNIIIESENSKKESDVIVKEITILKEKLKEAQTKFEINSDRVTSLRNEHNELSEKIQVLTFNKDIRMWY